MGFMREKVMARTIVFSLIAVGMVYVILVGISAVWGQSEALPPATIIGFSSDTLSITVADAEAGQTRSTFVWHTVGVSDTQQLRLEAYRVNKWESLLNTGEILPASGSREVTILHPLNFGPPTYRLSIVNSNSQVLDERTIVIPYDTLDLEEAPAISSFVTDATLLDANALARGDATIPVYWQVTNRPPNANLVFEQVLTDGRIVSVELPRLNLWVPSAGQGPTLPIYAQGETQLQLRLRLVDMMTGDVYDEDSLSLPISGTVVAPPAATAPPRPSPVPQPNTSAMSIVSFTVSPDTVDRGATVTLSWEVKGTAEVGIWRLQPGGSVADFIADQPLIGTWTLTLPEYYVDTAWFTLWATDAAGNTISADATVKIRCPYTYFFGQTAGETNCPYAPAKDISAVYQRFERGFMLWRSDNSQIYVLRDGGNLSRYQDTWTQADVLDTGTPPVGLLAPIRGFGKVWATQIGVKDALGWATGAEQTYTMRLQSSGAFKYAYLYLTLPDNRVIYLVESSWGLLGG
jgi:hypothetical protein